jgi:FtsH-binding integral membrane protein
MTVRHTESRLLLPGLAGLVLTIAGPFAYMASLDQPMLRATGLPAWVLMAAGIALCLVTARRTKRRGPWVLTGVTGLMTAAFLGMFFLAAALPSTNAAALRTAPDFTLNDHTGRPFHLAEELKRGPVLLIFYRGHW